MLELEMVNCFAGMSNYLLMMVSRLTVDYSLPRRERGNIARCAERSTAKRHRSLSQSSPFVGTVKGFYG